MSCQKVEHDSEQLARNAVTLHMLALPECPGFHAYPCGGDKADHWHVGHSVRGGRDECDRRHAGWHRGCPPGDRDTLQQ